MKNLLSKATLLVLTFTGTVFSAEAQKTPAKNNGVRMETRPGSIIYCPVPDRNTPYTPTYVAPPQEYLQKLSPNARPQADRSKFIVEYIDFPQEAKAAFQRAVDIWQSVIISDVPIKIRANWTILGDGILGSAYTTAIYRDFPGANKALTWYPVALAEKMAHKNLNGDDPDIIASFNANFDWSYQTVSVRGKEDLTSTVLHEIGHGLGFVSSFRAINNQTQGLWGYGFGPYIFDHYIENKTAQQIINQKLFENPSSALMDQYTSNALFFNSPSTTRNNNNTPAKLYAPYPYVTGSSISHLDEQTYKAGDKDALMTPQGAPGELTLNPGPIVLNMFKDMGWRGSSIIHTPFNDTEDMTKSFVFSIQVMSDTTYLPESIKMFYAINDNIKTKPVQASLTRIPNTDTYTFSLPASATERTISYYFQGSDLAGRTMLTPAEAPGKADSTFFYRFKVGADTTRPVVVYNNNISSMFSTETITKLPTLKGSDNIGIDTVYVEYSINGAVQKPFGLKRSNGDGILISDYDGNFEFPAGLLKGGEKITYRIVVKDKAKAKNTTYSPITGTYEFKVIQIQAPVAIYQTDFSNLQSTDFFTKGFSITTPASFKDPSMNSDHPYKDGSEEDVDVDPFTNTYFTLLKPVTLRADTAKIYFDEVVLVEPGETNAKFYNSDGSVNRQFYDYVIVEGSSDGGKTWKAFQAGWDSNDKPVWLSAWNSIVDQDNNSKAVGSPALFQKRQIDMLKAGYFKAGDKVLIRFKLHADAGAYGWGWTVDNLNIQGPAPGTSGGNQVLGLEEEVKTEVKLSPNPNETGEFRIEAKFVKPAGKVTLSVSTLTGKMLGTSTFEGIGTEFTQIVNLSNQAGGTYFIHLQVGDERIVKKAIFLR
ncbi:Por secretion system C-terminal sorting domain-containing protein [Pseudarcicella hirudinis]|uniref:Por secretion system C-terminal sorting domain-containing protein n=1 Tax=Pseudarcicella hirudinis TaxID=1079859 RepID=A0A1I5UIN2_9BACT|nr:T9SS type A sorting domain-containing protein [Pseudarcicella hirudinis]SFP94917.1 Por secretion system C-terminal sorting domain-containing protein [Pseudarcicella hirudinis]